MKLFFNKPLKILLFTNGLILIASAMLGPIYALFVEEIGGDLLDASLAGAVFAFAAGVTTLVSGKFADKIKENELIIVLGYVLIGIGFTLYTFVNSMVFLLIIQVMIGFGEAIYSPVFDAIYSKHLSIRKAGRQWGAWEAMNYYTAAFGAVIGGIIVYNFSFDALFVVMASLSFISAIYIYLLPRKVL